MPATITASGTWSVLQTGPASQAPGARPNEYIRQYRDTVEQAFAQTSLAYRSSFLQDIDGEQEVMQFVGLFAANYGIPATAALVRIQDILKGDRQSEPVEAQRVIAN